MTGSRRVLVTGIGVVSPLGSDRESTWSNLLSGQRACRRLDPVDDSHLYPPDYAGAPARHDGLSECADELARLGMGSAATTPTIAMALSAAGEAIEHAEINLPDLDLERAGCVVGTSKGGMHNAFAELSDPERHQRSRPLDQPDAMWWHRFAPSGPAASIAALFNLQGACIAPVTACATGLSSMLQAASLIRAGECDLVLAGSSDASLTPSVMASFRRLGVVTKSFDDAATAVRPFDQDRSGFLIGEGAAVVILESGEHAERRGARPLAEWITGGMASDASGLTQLEDEPDSLVWLMKDVLKRAGIAPGEVDYVSLHGTATPTNDRNELIAMRRVFGESPSGLCASSIKGSIGHLLGAAGSVEFASLLLAIRDGRVPPTLNLERPDPLSSCDLVPQAAREHEVNIAMKLSLGFGGHLVAGLVRSV